MSTGRHGPYIDDDHLVEVIEELAERDETISAGGVTSYRAAEELPFAHSTVREHCCQLAESGELEKVWGFRDGRPAVSFLPTDDEPDPEPVWSQTTAKGGSD